MDTSQVWNIVPKLAESTCVRYVDLTSLNKSSVSVDVTCIVVSDNMSNMAVGVFVCLFVSVCLIVGLFVCVSVYFYMSVYMFVCLSVCLFVRWSMWLFIFQTWLKVSVIICPGLVVLPTRYYKIGLVCLLVSLYNKVHYRFC